MKVLGLAHDAGRNWLIRESAWRFPNLLVIQYEQAVRHAYNCKQDAVRKATV